VSADAWMTLVVLGVMTAGLVTGKVSPPAGVLGASALLYVIGITSAAEAFSGFSNPAPITVAGLYVVAGAIDRTGAIEPVVSRLLAVPRRVRSDLARLVVPAAVGSAFLANTPIVAMLTPAVTRWSDEHHRSASTFLIPLSYATILGGAATAIGTSTNLVASGLLVESGEAPFGLFELAPIALPLALLGLVMIIVLAPVLLPERRRPRTPETGRSFTVSMLVEDGGPIDGRSVEQAGLRSLRGVYLVEIVRSHDVVIAPVRPQQTLRGSDRLVFAGQVDDIVDLQGTVGLISAEAGAHDALAMPSRTGFFEVVIGPSSPLVGRTAAELDFRKRYDGGILAIHRSGRPVESKLGSVQFRPGDTLLIVAERGFRIRWKDTGEFLLVSRLDAPMPAATNHSLWALAALAAIVVLPILGWLSVSRATVLAAILVVLSGVLRPREARDAVDVNVVLMIGGAFGLGEAVSRSGLADVVADQLMNGFGWAGALGAAVGVVIVTMVLTELITNAAAVVLVYPIALDIAERTTLDPRTLVIGAAVAGSASFLTPVGYQTNMMVYGPGGYRFTDYLRLGIPLSLINIAMVSGVITTQT
jgi:di/tricarboxylate transporter